MILFYDLIDQLVIITRMSQNNNVVKELGLIFMFMG